MNDEAGTREVLDDARAYIDARAFQAAIELIDEGADRIGRNVPALSQALELLDTCFLALAQAGDAQAARNALDLLFRLAIGRLFAGRRADPAALERYKRALARTGSSAIPLGRFFRHQNLMQLFMASGPVAGEVAECGCARGLSSMQLCLAISEVRPHWRGSGLHIFDSFEGLSAPGSEDLDMRGIGEGEAARIQDMMRAGNMAVPLEQVRAAFAMDFPEVAFHAGWIPESFAGLPERQYRFVHVDVDLYQPTLEAFRYFHPRLAPGGVLVTDDYNWPGARNAVDEFCAAKGLTPRLTGTNQAYLVAE